MVAVHQGCNTAPHKHKTNIRGSERRIKQQKVQPCKALGLWYSPRFCKESSKTVIGFLLQCGELGLFFFFSDGAAWPV